ncbi:MULTISPECIES: permease-like cell division protein FtsX [Arthrobacter]|uniref:Cell division protein FtsX n=1 Tax=Arthrobacter jinronghuae TaxID=2964609 RepID=A0ABT1NP56_9MICC|nr:MULTISPECIES: permease-like cell division protein FtsX [Arthrobacter]MCQ1949520.1 permease-like cell division protein FtsX [Arthrobacter jinronghuae]MCQ1952840.1 permease-like cell division protein FtsX [Arthrobacter sp. zg-Y238]MCQ1955039.1 permease-like cell division protein FtsX [Arthrobacter jinronghuae]UWX77711.1 permease-like cell division protein FtsX [Arthrobacter jinronghuae]
MRLAFVLGEIGSGLRRNLSMVVSVVLVTFVSLTFVGAAGLLQLQIGQMKGYWYDRVQVAVYLCTENDTSASCASGAVTDEQREAIEADLQSDRYVETVEYEDQETALTHFREQFANSPIVDSITAEMLPESFRVSLVDPEKYEVINEAFSSKPGVESVSDQRELFEKMFTYLNLASVAALAIAGVMLVCAILLIATTIRLSAFSRRRETGIMRLVGASKAVIQLPFVLEGVIAAVIGAVLASAALLATAHFFIGNLARQYPTTAFISSEQVLYLTPVLLVLGALLAGVSSLLTLRRYLKV